MSRNDEVITSDALRLAAELTLNQHRDGGNIWNPGTCWQCTPDGCPQLRWALDVRAGRNPAYPGASA